MKTSEDNLTLVTGGASRLTIDSSGNVGIGTTSPSHMLSVYHTSRDASTNLNGGNSDTIPALAIQSTSATWANAVNGFGFYYSSTDGDLDLYRKSESATQNHVLTVKRSDGNVGIGTTTPGYKLTVAGNANISGARFISNSFINFTNNTAFNETLYVINGNIGIGTTGPYDKLDVPGSASGGLGGRLVITNSAVNAINSSSELAFKSGADFIATYYTGAINVAQTGAADTSNAMIFRLYGTDTTPA